MRCRAVEERRRIECPDRAGRHEDCNFTKSKSEEKEAKKVFLTFERLSLILLR